MKSIGYVKDNISIHGVSNDS